MWRHNWRQPAVTAHATRDDENPSAREKDGTHATRSHGRRRSSGQDDTCHPAGPGRAHGVPSRATPRSDGLRSRRFQQQAYTAATRRRRIIEFNRCRVWSVSGCGGSLGVAGRRKLMHCVPPALTPTYWHHPLPFESLIIRLYGAYRTVNVELRVLGSEQQAVRGLRRHIQSTAVCTVSSAGSTAGDAQTINVNTRHKQNEDDAG